MCVLNTIWTSFRTVLFLGPWCPFGVHRPRTIAGAARHSLGMSGVSSATLMGFARICQRAAKKGSKGEAEHWQYFVASSHRRQKRQWGEDEWASVLGAECVARTGKSRNVNHWPYNRGSEQEFRPGISGVLALWQFRHCASPWPSAKLVKPRLLKGLFDSVCFIKNDTVKSNQ